MPWRRGRVRNRPTHSCRRTLSGRTRSTPIRSITSGGSCKAVPRPCCGTRRGASSCSLGSPPGETTHWNGRLLAKAAGVSLRSGQRILDAHQRRPHSCAPPDSARSRYGSARSSVLSENGITRPLRQWPARRAIGQPRKHSARVVQAPNDKNKVQFGVTVTVKRESGRTQIFRIVGEDEANPSRGTVSYVLPFARAVLGNSLGDKIRIAGEEAQVLEIA